MVTRFKSLSARGAAAPRQRRDARANPPARARFPARSAKARVSPVYAAPWAVERAELLPRICRLADRRIALGGKVDVTLKALARRFDGRPLKRDRGRKLQCSFPTLRRLYYCWLHAGRRRAGLELHYRPPTKVHRRDLAALGAAALSPDTRSLADAWRRLHCPPGGYYGFRCALPSRLKQALARLFTARRMSLASGREVAQQVAALSRTTR